MTALKNIDQLPPAIRPAVVSYLEEMLSLHEGNLLSVFLYGSAAGANYVPKHSDINLCFIFKKLDFEVLEESLKSAAKGAKKKITAPLFFTKEMIVASSDVFPVEFLEMKEHHQLGNADIGAGNLRYRIAAGSKPNKGRSERISRVRARRIRTRRNRRRRNVIVANDGGGQANAQASTAEQLHGGILS